ncbi:MAG: DNA repair protein RadA [Candidatus Zixiibacteriota bacterium]|nr:MAG: DNA repair protein RadA [candidate division Zixibacteria bacterium]
MATSRKSKTAFFCTRCGAEHPRWQGQCRECGEWNCLAEEKLAPRQSKTGRVTASKPIPVARITGDTAAGFVTGINELDRVLGGRLLPGMTVLLGGEPGIGKSTLVLQAAEAYSAAGLPVLYATGEESPSQLKMRAARLGVTGDRVSVLNTTSLDETLDALASGEYRIIIVDSIQTMATDELDSPPGTVAQVREVSYRLINHAKAAGTGLFLIGHVTKDGMVAGPKLLEHMVDTVIYFEGDSTHLYRMLRATKNRFGSVSEIGLFEMQPDGLIEVANPSTLFLSDQAQAPRSGSVVAAICEGNRPILVELQALVTAASYGTPQRVAGGIDQKRLALLLAILEKRCGYPMGTNDVFASVAGGLRLSEPALDLPLIAAIVSSLLNKPLDARTAVVGEVGLSGEVRGVAMADRRVSEAARLGFKRMLIPRVNADKLSGAELEITGVDNIQTALDIVLG